MADAETDRTKVAKAFADERLRRNVRKAVDKEEREKQQPVELTLVSAADVVRTKQERVFGGRIERGNFSFIVGQGEAGKGVVSADIIARLSTGAPFPGENGTWRKPMRVLVCIVEDSREQVVGRMDACGADLKMVSFVEGPPVMRGGLVMSSAMRLDSDAAPMVALAKKVDAGAIFIETLVEHLGDRDRPGVVSTHTEADVRAALGPFRAICKEASLFGWALIHPRKGTGGEIAEAISGSQAFHNVPRIVLQVFKDPEDQTKTPRRLLATVKANNLGKKPETIRFSIESWEKDQDFPRAVWGVEGKSLEDPRSADEIYEQIRDKQKNRKDMAVVGAEKWLRETIAEQGLIPPDKMKALAESSGISWAAILRAKKNLDMVSIREQAFGAKVLGWQFPESEL